jgi:Tfp pilus assembly protein PilN
MPKVRWEWKIGPQTLIGIAQLVAIIVAVIGGFVKMQADIQASNTTIAQLQTIVSSIKDAQARQSDRITRVETKVDLMLPAMREIPAAIDRLQSRLTNP